MFKKADLFIRRLFAWPLVFTGLLLTYIAAGMIHVGAWIIDLPVETTDANQS